MKTKRAYDDLQIRAVEALRTLLAQVSMIKVRHIRCDATSSVLAHVDVLGHGHTLACEVIADARPENLCAALRKLCNGAAQLDPPAIPVLIAPHLSPEAQVLCKQNAACFLDLEGNARLALGEVFIGRRALTPRFPAPKAANPGAFPAYSHTRFQASPAA